MDFAKQMPVVVFHNKLLRDLTTSVLVVKFRDAFHEIQIGNFCLGKFHRKLGKISRKLLVWEKVEFLASEKIVTRSKKIPQNTTEITTTGFPTNFQLEFGEKTFFKVSRD